MLALHQEVEKMVENHFYKTDGSKINLRLKLQAGSPISSFGAKIS